MNIFQRQEAEGAAFGVNRYEDKVDAIEELKQNEISVEKAQGFATELFHEGINGTINAIKYAQKTFTPGFVQRYYSKKIHEKEIEDKEGLANIFLW